MISFASLSLISPWITNPWSKGIAAGIVSGILVAWVSQRFLSRRYRRRAVLKIGAANREIMQAVRLMVAEGQIPRRDVIAALTNATARRRGLAPTDLYQTVEIAEDLIKDVMESSLLSAAKKSEICAQLSYLLMTLPAPGASRDAQEAAAARKSSVAGGQNHKPEAQRVSALTGILAGVLSGVFAGRGLLGRYLGALPHGLRFGLEALAGIAAALAALFIVALIFGDASGDGSGSGRESEIEDAATEGGATRNTFLGG